jgi:hypothetical protein
MTPTVALTGELPFVVVVSSFLGFVASALLLLWYRGAVRRRMRQGTWEPAVTTPATVPPPRVPLRIRYADVTPDEFAPAGRALYLSARRAPWRAAAVYAGGGLFSAAVLAVAFLWSGGTEPSPLRFLVLLWVYLWPLVPTLFLTAATSRRDKALVAAGYIAVYAALTVATVVRSPDASASQMLAVWLEFDLIPTLFIAAFLSRRVRAVGPLVVTFLLFAVTGAVLLPDLLGVNQTLLDGVSDLFTTLGVGADATFVVLILIGLVIFAVLAWPVLQLVRRAYEKKRVDDQSLILDAVWLFFAINYGIDLAFGGAFWVVAGLVAFAAYLVTVRLGLRYLARRGAEEGPSLLVLRVFALGKRSENLFRVVSNRWRHVGTVQLIAGPDLATSTVEPHEFLDFVSGRLDRQFIDGREAFDRRLAALDTRPDFDGRFRVNDFFCYQDTWQPTLRALVGRSGAVLMDLRSFSSEQKGCIYEIRQLFECVPLTRIVVVVDDTTDMRFFEDTLSEVWNQTPVHAPNRALARPELRVVKGRQEGWGNLDGLLAALCRAATTSV